MKRWRRNLLSAAAACVLAVVVTWAVWPGEREPEYKGKRLSEWIKAFEVTLRPPRVSGEETLEAIEAVAHIGTNAVPWLVRWIAYQRPAWQQHPWVQATFSKVPIPSVQRWALWGGDAHAKAAVVAIGILGPEAEAAVPELTKLIHDDSRPESRDRAIEALGSRGQAGFAPLLALLEEKQTAGDLYVANLCADKIVMTDPAEAEIIASLPVLLLPPCALWRLRSRPAFIPAVTNCLTHSNAIVRSLAIQYLGSVLRDPDGSVRAEARAALSQVAPEVLMNQTNRVPRKQEY